MSTEELDPYTTPAMPPPPGEESNLVDPYSTQYIAIIVASICMAGVYICISLRMWVRVRIMKQFDLTDICLIMGGLCFTAFCSLVLLAGRYGQGTHMWNISLADLSEMLLIANVIEIMYGPTMFFPKYVVLRQIDGIFANHKRKSLMSRIIWGMIWANLLFYASMSISFICACVPRSAVQNPEEPGAVCINTNAAVLATGGINILSDIIILFIPLFGLARLQMPHVRKIGAAAVFGVGVFAVAASCVRMYYSVLLTESSDMTWTISPVGNWAIAEFTTVILVGCFPSFPRLWKDCCGSRRDKTGYEFHSSDYSRKPSSKNARAANLSGGQVTVTQSYHVHDDAGSSTTALAELSDEGVGMHSMGAYPDSLQKPAGVAL